MKKYVSRIIEFAYPNNKGKTNIESIEILATIENAEKFDKFYNFITSLAVASGMNAIPIHDYSNNEKD